jgi:hypothetical protein
METEKCMVIIDQDKSRLFPWIFTVDFDWHNAAGEIAGRASPLETHK